MIWTAARHLLASPVEVSPVDRPHGLDCPEPESLAPRTCNVGTLSLRPRSLEAALELLMTLTVDWVSLLVSLHWKRGHQTGR